MLRFLRRCSFPVFALLLLASCSEDFKVGAPYKAVTVVYGLMDMGDSAHYIRIQKAYYDESRSAIDLSQVADSSFYSSLDVHLKEVSDTGSNATVLNDETLVRVNLNDEGYIKNTGNFFTSPNWAYKTKRALSPDKSYRIVVTNPLSGERDSAATRIINNNFIVYDFNSGFEVNFPAVRETNNFTVSMKIPDNAQYFEGIIRFHWVDKTLSGVQTNDSADWTFASIPKQEGKDGLVLSVPQRAFYSFLRDAVGTPEDGVARYLDSADVFVWAGSYDLYTYQIINGAQGGLTADQIKPVYTNLKGQNVYGLYTSRTSRVRRSVRIDDVSLDSLMNNSVTKPLNFKGRSDH